MKAVRVWSVKRNAREKILHHAELHPPGFADHALVPRWIPDALDVGFVHAIDGENFTLGIVRDGGAHAATGRSERHLHGHFRAAFRPLRELTIVNQTEI